MTISLSDHKQPDAIELNCVVGQTNGYPTDEERIQKVMLDTITSVDLIRNDNVANLYLCKFQAHEDGGLSLHMQKAMPIFKSWKLVGWNIPKAPDDPDFYIQEDLKPDPRVIKVLRRKGALTSYRISCLKHTLKGFCVKELNMSMSFENKRLIYQTMILAKYKLKDIQK